MPADVREIRKAGLSDIAASFKLLSATTDEIAEIINDKDAPFMLRYHAEQMANRNHAVIGALIDRVIGKAPQVVLPESESEKPAESGRIYEHVERLVKAKQAQIEGDKQREAKDEDVD